MNPLLLPNVLLMLSIVFYIAENIQERPNILRSAVYVMAAVVSFLYMSSVLDSL
jgi:hypothetical protein